MKLETQYGGWWLMVSPFFLKEEEEDPMGWSGCEGGRKAGWRSEVKIDGGCFFESDFEVEWFDLSTLLLIAWRVKFPKKKKKQSRIFLLWLSMLGICFFLF